MCTSHPISTRRRSKMQAPTSSQERDELDETDERTDLSIGHLFRSRFAMDSRFARVKRERTRICTTMAVSRWRRYREMSSVTDTVKRLIFSAAASLLFLFLVVPFLGHMNVVETVGGTATVIVVALFSLSAAGLIAEGCIWFVNNKLQPSIVKRISSPVSGSPSALESQQPTPAPAPAPTEIAAQPEQPDASTAAISTPEIVARIEAIETRLKEMNSSPEQQTVAPAPVVVTPPTSKAPKVTASPPAQQQQQQQKKNQNHVDALLGGAS